MAEEANKFVDEAITSKPVVIFSKSYCPYCKKAKSLLLDTVKVPQDNINIIEIEDRPDMTEIQARLKDITGALSVPRVFIKGKSIGGCDDLFKIHGSGELANLL